jgi:hypothetical protein
VRAIALLLCLTAAGCGYIMRGSTQKVLIDSSPSRSQVQVDGATYTTPVELELARGRHHTVTAQSTGGTPVATHIESQTQWRYQVVDLLITPIIGNIIDGASGGDSNLVPSKVVLPLGR